MPLSFGPWKFQGLPGLILEISDDQNYIHWTAVKIKYPAKSSISVSDLDKLPTQKVTLKQFVAKVDTSQAQMQAKIMKLMPRGTVSNIDTNKRIGIELEYEWESVK